MNGPEFVCIGVQRGGTSWLYQCFKEHPEIFMPGKEIHFFDQHYDKGIDWYSKLFEGSYNGCVKGEMTPDYIFKQDALIRLKKHYPKAKLILILRDPIARAHSAVGLLKAKGRFQNQTFAEIVDKEKWLIDQSLYHKQLLNLFDIFPRDQILIFKFEDIANRPLWLLKTVFQFIGVNYKFKPKAFSEKFNIAATSKFSNVINLERIQTKLRRYAAGRLLLKLKKLKPVKMLKHWLSDYSPPNNKGQDACPNALKAEFQADIIRTEKLLGINLSSWYQV